MRRAARMVMRRPAPTRRDVSGLAPAAPSEAAELRNNQQKAGNKAGAARAAHARAGADSGIQPSSATLYEDARLALERRPGAQEPRRPGPASDYDSIIAAANRPAVQAARQRAADGHALDAEIIHRAAGQGIRGSGDALPHRDTIQRSFGRHDIGHVSAHVGGVASEAADTMGAQAYTIGHHVAFRSAPDLHTAAHEAAHVVQQRGGVQLRNGVGAAGDTYERHADAVADAVVAGRSAAPLLDAAPGAGASSASVQLRSATWLERRAWLAFFDHYLPRMFLNNYMDDTGAAITLNQQQMQDCNPIVDIRRSSAFMAQVARLQAAGGGTEPVSVSGWGGAMTNGTLGNFTIHWNGTVVVSPDGSWTFTGTIDFYDFWDFDPKGSGSGRPLPAEIKVRVADMFLPGRPFPIHSVRVPASQSSGDARASWPSAVRHVPDRAARTGADIATGEVGGDVGGGLIGGEVGGEAGAQSAEDLNP
jgi:hypothetical protein